MRWKAATVSWLALSLLSVVYADVVISHSRGDLDLSLVGPPLLHSPPRFYIPATPDARQRSPSLVYVASQLNIVAALKPADGSIVWRQQIPLDQPIIDYHLFHDVMLVTAGQGGAHIYLFQAASGHLLWSAQHHDPAHGFLTEPGLTGAHADLDGTGIYAIANGITLSKRSGATGDLLWQWDARQAGLLEPTSFLHRVLLPASPSAPTSVVILHRHATHYTLSVVSLDSTTGQTLASPTPLKPKLAHPSHLLTFPGGKLVFLDSNGVLHSVCTTSSSGEVGKVLAHREKRAVVALESVDLESDGYFVARQERETASVMRVDDQCKLTSAWDFADETPGSIYSGSLDRAGEAHVSKLYFSKSMQMVMMSTFSAAPTSFSPAGMVQGSTIPVNVARDGEVLHLTTEVVPRSTEPDAKPILVSRSVFTTAAGTLQLWRGTIPDWVREEGLALVDDGGAVAFVDVSEKRAKPMARDEGVLEEIERRAWAVVELGVDTAKATYEGTRAMLRPKPKLAEGEGEVDWMRRTFGFRKIALVASPLGKLVALDLSMGGAVTWQRTLLPVVDEVKSGERRMYWKALVPVEGDKEVLAVAEVHDGPTSVSTYAFHLSALDGQTPAPRHGVSLAPGLLFDGPCKAAFQLPGALSGHLAIVDGQDKVSLWPSLANPASPSIRFTAQDGPHALHGYSVAAGWKEGDVARRAWSFVAPMGESIVSVVKPAQGPVASLGRVLGDRSTLYKYLSPHLTAVATTAGVHLIEAVSGSIVWSALHRDEVAEGSSISIAAAENWVVFAFADAKAPGVTTRVVSVELYYHVEPNSTYSSYAPPSEVPHAYTRSFVLAQGVKSLSMTQTRRGISSRALLVYTDRDSIVAIPRRLLDPRRPLTAKPSKPEAEEGLIPYDPLLPIDPRLTLSLGQRVVGGLRLLSTSTLLESTSLVLCLGHGDVWSGRISPSGAFDTLSDEFNKVQLLLTMAGLALGILVTRPIVKGRALRAKWYA